MAAEGLGISHFQRIYVGWLPVGYRPLLVVAGDAAWFAIFLAVHVAHRLCKTCLTLGTIFLAHGLDLLPALSSDQV